ncbi:uncharacterized protein LOC144061335 isoform X3 [Vanacampus margaritifer]
MEAELREPYDDCDLRGNKMRADPASDFPERSFMTDARAVPKSERLRLMSWNLNINRRKLFAKGGLLSLGSPPLHVDLFAQ